MNLSAAEGCCPPRGLPETEEHYNDKILHRMRARDSRRGQVLPLLRSVRRARRHLFRELVPRAGYQQAPENARWLNDYRRVTAYLLLLWGVIALIDGIYSAVLSESSADTMIDALEDAGLWENGEYMGLDRNDFVNIILVSSMAEIISGALALVSGHFTFRAQKYKLSLWCCLLSTIFACFGIITLICGIYVTYRISNCKESFGS